MNKTRNIIILLAIVLLLNQNCYSMLKVAASTKRTISTVLVGTVVTAGFFGTLLLSNKIQEEVDGPSDQQKSSNNLQYAPHGTIGGAWPLPIESSQEIESRHWETREQRQGDLVASAFGGDCVNKLEEESQKKLLETCLLVQIIGPISMEDEEKYTQVRKKLELEILEACSRYSSIEFPTVLDAEALRIERNLKVVKAALQFQHGG